MNKEEFTDIFNRFAEAYPPRKEESVSFFHEQLWEELKFSKPIIKQIFRKIAQSWEKGFFPPIAEFVKIRNEIKRSGQIHFPENHDCDCIDCVQMKRYAQGLCYNCGKSIGYPYECPACHLNKKVAALDGKYEGLWKCSCIICKTLELTDLDLSHHDKDSLKTYVMMKKENLSDLKKLFERRQADIEFGDDTVLVDDVFDEINKSSGKNFDPDSMKI